MAHRRHRPGLHCVTPPPSSFTQTPKTQTNLHIFPLPHIRTNLDRLRSIGNAQGQQRKMKNEKKWHTLVGNPIEKWIFFVLSHHRGGPEMVPLFASPKRREGAVVYVFECFKSFTRRRKSRPFSTALHTKWNDLQSRMLLVLGFGSVGCCFSLDLLHFLRTFFVLEDIRTRLDELGVSVCKKCKHYHIFYVKCKSFGLIFFISRYQKE